MGKLFFLSSLCRLVMMVSSKVMQKLCLLPLQAVILVSSCDPSSEISCELWWRSPFSVLFCRPVCWIQLMIPVHKPHCDAEALSSVFADLWWWCEVVIPVQKLALWRTSPFTVLSLQTSDAGFSLWLWSQCTSCSWCRTKLLSSVFAGWWQWRQVVIPVQKLAVLRTSLFPVPVMLDSAYDPCSQAAVWCRNSVFCLYWLMMMVSSCDPWSESSCEMVTPFFCHVFADQWCWMQLMIPVQE